MNEERLDRRAHWVQVIAAALVAATVWCVKLEMTASALKAQITSLWDKFGQDHDRLTRHDQWIKDHELSRVRD